MSIVEFASEYPVVLAASVAVGALLVFAIFSSKKKVPATALNPEVFQPFELQEKVIVSPDTRIFRFKLHAPEQKLGLPIGQHMYLKANIDGKDVQRAYTPISSDDDLGRFDLMIKVYFANVHPKFPDGGKLTQYLEKMKIGETIAVRGPTGRFEYLGCGEYQTKVGKEFVKHHTNKIGMIAGGTGITPMLQILRAILKDPQDRTEVWLLFANQTEQDILLRKELEECAKDKRVHLWYTLDRPAAGWKYSEGFVNLDMIKERMPDTSDKSTIILMCGPPPMITHACKPNLLAHGFSDDQMFTF